MKTAEEIVLIAEQEAKKLHDKSKHDDWNIYDQLVDEDARLIALGYAKCQEDMADEINELKEQKQKAIDLLCEADEEINQLKKQLNKQD